MINLTIDDNKLSVAEGTTILKAAESAGIEIPTLCYHGKLSPMGACRVCIVEVEGEDRPVASCDTPAREGMVVRTDTDEIKRQREQMIQFMLLHHPLDCPVCDKAGECEVQDITVAMGIMEQSYSSTKPDRRREKLSSVLDLWHSRCVMCGRCVQICKEVQGARAIDNVVRSGFASKVGPMEADGYPCESCGQCLSMCPVGAILDSTFMYSARAWQLDEIDSICTSCGVGCSYKLGVRENKVYRVTVGDFQGYNRGNLCSVGRFGRDAADSEARLLAPAIRSNGSLEETSWEQALDFAAQRLQEVASSNGGSMVAGLASASCTNEALYLFQRLMREGLGTDRIDTPARLNNLAIIETMTDVYGVPAPTATLADVDEADTILVLDSNIVSTHPVAALELLRVHNAGSAKLLVTGHRSNKLTTQCAQFARTAPGTEPALLNCLANALVESGSLDDAALGQSTEGFDKLKAHVAKYSPSDTATRTGIDASIITDIADAISASKNFLLVLAPGSLHSAVNSSIVRAAVNLSVLKGGKVLSLLGEGNAQGALDMGITPDFLPGYEEATGAHGGSLEAAEILRAVESGEVKALYLLGGDIRREMALLGLSLDTLKSLELLIVQDVYGSPVADMAHVALPASGPAEREGAYTNAFRIVQRSPEAVRPRGQSRSDSEILDALSAKLGLSAFDSTANMRAQIASSFPAYESANGGAWDYSKVATGARRKLSTVEETSPTLDETYPYILTFDVALHFGGASSLHSESLAELRDDGIVEIGEDDALALGVEDGAVVEVKVKGGGAAKLPVRVSAELPKGVVNVPSHSYDLIGSLIPRLDLAAARAGEGVPVWTAGLSVGGE
jgi:predicted molibdopterin-dependent oxidoreductase YjgC